MARIFDSISVRKPKRNAFNLSHENKLSFNMGDLVPILCQEVIPGDTFKVQASLMLRLAPMIAPVMHKVNVFTYFFFVPYRLIWDESKEFFTGGEDGTANPVFPRFLVNNLSGYSSFRRGMLSDYLGIPPIDGVPSHAEYFSSLPFRAYQLIWNEYFRDQNLQEELVIPRTSGIEASSNINLLTQMRKKCWEKDYFTSALPWAQRGAPVTLPMAGNPSIFLDPLADKPSLFNVIHRSGAGTTDFKAVNASIGSLDQAKLVAAPGMDDNELQYDPNGQLKVDMSDVTSATINELRQAIKLQEWLELAARGGSRYIEQMYAFFGVKSSDARLQRPEYLGGGRSPIIISEVLQTAESSATSPQGNMSGHGLSLNSAHQFKRFFEEHGLVIGITCVMPRTAYQQGLPRMYSKFDRFDYFWPQFAHLGEQEVLNKELYLDWKGSAEKNSATFGYQSRYAEYKFIPSSVHGEFRDSLNFWHMGRIFSSAPSLNASFVEADPTNRIFAVEDPNLSARLYAQIQFDIKAVRPMPKYGTPYF